MIRSQRGNGIVWSADRPKGHVESFFMKFNDQQSGMAVWLKFTIYAPKDDPAKTVGECWAIYFDANDPSQMTGMKETFPIGECRIDTDPLRLQFGENVFEPGRTSGSLKKDEQTISWDLTWTEGKKPLFLFPADAMYTFRLPKSKAISPFPDSLYSGTVTVNGKKIAVEDFKGMQGHNWGEEHAHHYCWVQGSIFDGGEDGYFEAFSGKVRIGPVITPFVSLAFLHLDGRLYRFDHWRRWLSGKVDLTTNRWSLEIGSDEHLLRAEVSAPVERFAGLNYYDPTGKLSYCLNSKIADAKIELIDRASRWVLKKLSSTGGFAIEVLTKESDHGVRMLA